MDGRALGLTIRPCLGGFNDEREEVIVDVMLIIVVLFVGGMLGLLVEFLKHLYPIYLALVLLLAATLLNLLGRMIRITKQEL
jgi:hypothetical protein